MEDTLRVLTLLLPSKKYPVLILVLMEDTLRAILSFRIESEQPVLILVLMEDTLRAKDFSASKPYVVVS